MHSTLIETLKWKAAERAVERAVTNARFWADRQAWRDWVRACARMGHDPLDRTGDMGEIERMWRRSVHALLGVKRCQHCAGIREMGGVEVTTGSGVVHEACWGPWNNALRLQQAASLRDCRSIEHLPPGDVSVGMLLDQEARDLIAETTYNKGPWIKRWDC
jgi:hypothetical protein